MEVLSENVIRQWILPALTFSAHGRPSVVEPAELAEAILYKLKSGCQWRLLPVKQFFMGASLTWQGVYARFNAWRKDGSWQGVWLRLLRENAPPTWTVPASNSTAATRPPRTAGRPSATRAAKSPHHHGSVPGR